MPTKKVREIQDCKRDAETPYLWGEVIASVKVKFCHGATFALGATLAVLGKDTPIPLG